jgi:hypothetical protein
MVYIVPSLGLGHWLKVMNALAVLAGVLWLEVTAHKSSTPGRNVWPFCGYLIAALMVSPMAETHHLTLIVPGAFLVGHKAMYDGRWATRGVVALLASFTFCFVVVAKVYKYTPFFFVSLVMLLVLIGLAINRTDATKNELSPGGSSRWIREIRTDRARRPPDDG